MKFVNTPLWHLLHGLGLAVMLIAGGLADYIFDDQPVLTEFREGAVAAILIMAITNHFFAKMREGN